MEKVLILWSIVWKRYFKKISTLSIGGKIALVIMFSFLTGLSAQIYVKLPFTPVPVTGQVFVVLLSGILIGKNFAALSQGIYLTGGVFGINWFFGGGPGILRPTLGYIAGFVFASYMVGWINERKERSTALQIFSMLAGISIIYLFGIIYLSFYLKITIYKAFIIGALPFIPFDILKAYLAGLVSHSILKQKR